MEVKYRPDSHASPAKIKNIRPIWLFKCVTAIFNFLGRDIKIGSIKFEIIHKFEMILIYKFISCN